MVSDLQYAVWSAFHDLGKMFDNATLVLLIVGPALALYLLLSADLSITAMSINHHLAYEANITKQYFNHGIDGQTLFRWNLFNMVIAFVFFLMNAVYYLMPRYRKFVALIVMMEYLGILVEAGVVLNNIHQLDISLSVLAATRSPIP